MPTVKVRTIDRKAKMQVQTKIWRIGWRMPSEVRIRVKFWKPMPTRHPGETLWPASVSIEAGVVIGDEARAVPCGEHAVLAERVDRLRRGEVAQARHCQHGAVRRSHRQGLKQSADLQRLPHGVRSQAGRPRRPRRRADGPRLPRSAGVISAGRSPLAGKNRRGPSAVSAKGRSLPGARSSLAR